MKLIRVYFLLFICLNTASAQNLVPDSSFEMNKFVPIEYSSLSASTSWNAPSRGTTDLFCKCTDKKIKNTVVNVPKNSMGEQEANSGSCYAGFFACSHGYYREYLQTELVSKLKKGKNYIFSMYVSLSDYSTLAIDQLGVCFLNGKVNYPHSDVITDLKPIYIPIETEIGVESMLWHQLTFTYTAKGGESCLLIGSFQVNRLIKTGNIVPQEISTPINKRLQRDAYYYIDDVSLLEEKIIIDSDTIPFQIPVVLDSAEVVIVKPAVTTNTQVNNVLILKNVLFQTGESILSPVSYTELNSLAAHLIVEMGLRVEIYGHTDNAGDEKANLELSTNRAKAVCDYLIGKGIDSKRIAFKGYGSSKPIASNDTEEGRKQNRRVEFLLVN